MIRQLSKRIRWQLVVREVEERRKLPSAVRRRREEELLRAACPDGAVRIVLDRSGQMLASADLARHIELWQNSGKDVAFVVGGPEGLSPQFRDEATMVLGFGAATWPHRLVRVMLVEQIYRAQEILLGRPYAREGLLLR